VILFRDRRTLRKRNVAFFLRTMAERHPELRQPILHFRTVEAIARRERIVIQQLPLSRPGRLVRVDGLAFIQINKALPEAERIVVGMHELCHFWRDDSGEACYNVEDDILLTDAEEFADIFAWVATSPARIYLPGLREEDFQ
jgi:Zn-dependent peptidase ImmA (M78 family)